MGKDIILECVVTCIIYIYKLIYNRIRSFSTMSAGCGVLVDISVLCVLVKQIEMNKI